MLHQVAEDTDAGEDGTEEEVFGEQFSLDVAEGVTREVAVHCHSCVCVCVCGRVKG